MRSASDVTPRIDVADTVVCLQGRLDAAAVGTARDLLSEALASGEGNVVLDSPTSNVSTSPDSA